MQYKSYSFLYLKKWYPTIWWRHVGKHIIPSVPRGWFNVVPSAFARDSCYSKTYPWFFATTSNPLRRQRLWWKIWQIQFYMYTLSMQIDRGLNIFITELSNLCLKFVFCFLYISVISKYVRSNLRCTGLYTYIPLSWLVYCPDGSSTLL